MDEFDFYEEEDIDPRAELVQKLIEYRKYKGIAKHLQEREWERSLIYAKEPEDLTPWVPQVNENPVRGLHAADLVAAFQKALRKAVRRTSYTRINATKSRLRTGSGRSWTFFRSRALGESAVFPALARRHGKA